jgi:hypothetical protein
MDTQQIIQEPIGSIHILLTVLGALLYNLIELDRIRRKKDVKFSFFIWINENWLSIIISSIALVVCFLLRGQMQDLMGFDMTNRTGCFFAGFTAHTLISKLRGMARKSPPPDK